MSQMSIHAALQHCSVLVLIGAAFAKGSLEWFTCSSLFGHSF